MFKENSHFQGVSSDPEMAFQIQALFKEFKDLHEPCLLIINVKTHSDTLLSYKNGLHKKMNFCYD